MVSVVEICNSFLSAVVCGTNFVAALGPKRAYGNNFLDWIPTSGQNNGVAWPLRNPLLPKNKILYNRER